jgi:hypothetical protein
VILLVVETDDWPPWADDYFPRRILLRLGSLRHLTQVRSAVGPTTSPRSPCGRTTTTWLRLFVSALRPWQPQSGRWSSFPGDVRRPQVSLWPNEYGQGRHADIAAVAAAHATG